MTDNRFPSPGVDARFPTPGVDARFPSPGIDLEHLPDGTDTRFQGTVYGGFSPAVLFAGGEQGAWFDPSDLTTLFQDTAGTTPVTAPGQTAGLMLDKSQGATLGPEKSLAAVPIVIDGSTPGDKTNITPPVAGRHYLLEYTVTASTLSAGTDFYIEPGNSGLGYTVLPKTPGSYRFILVAQDTQTGLFSTGGPGPYSGTISLSNISVRELTGNHATQPTAAARPTYGVVPATGRRNLLLATDTMSTQSVTVAAVAHTLAFTGTGTVTLSGASTAGPLVGTGVSNRVSLNFTPTAGSLTLTVSGSVTLAQLELGSTATAYQRVVSAFDVTEAGVASLGYLAFDGVDDFLVTPTITPGIDKVQVFAGVRKLSDAAVGVFLESSTNGSSQNGTVRISCANPINTYDFVSRGTLNGPAVSPASFASPTTDVLTGVGDISGDLSTLRVNGVQVAQATGDQGTGNFLAYPLFIGRRGGTSLPFNGHLYSIIARFGANLTADQITATETWVAAKTGVTL